MSRNRSVGGRLKGGVVLTRQESRDAGDLQRARPAMWCRVGLAALLIAVFASGIVTASEPLLKLVASDGLEGDEFGGAVATDGDFLVVGARAHASPFTDPNVPGLLPKDYPWSGQAYVYRYVADPGATECAVPDEPPCWILDQALPNPDPRYKNCCGYPSVGCKLPALDVPFDPATQAPEIPNDCQEITPARPGFPPGCDPDLPGPPFGDGCFVDPTPEEFVDNGVPGWNASPGVPSTSDQFGTSVAISGDLIVVGSPGDRGVGATHTGNWLVGAAWIYRRVGALETDQYCAGDPAIYEYPTPPPTMEPPCWVVEKELNNGGRGTRRYFGDAVAVHGDVVAAGQPLNVTSFGDGSAPPGQYPKVYVFEYDGADWQSKAVLEGSQNAVLEGYEYFGSALAMSDETIVVGAMGNNEQAYHTGEVVPSRGPAAWAGEEITSKNGEVSNESLCPSGQGCRIDEIVAVKHPPILEGSLSLFGSGLPLVEGVDYDEVDLEAGTFRLLKAQRKGALSADYQGSEEVKVAYRRIVAGTLQVLVSGVPLVEGEGFSATAEQLDAGRFLLIQPQANGTVTADYHGGQMIQVRYPPIALHPGVGDDLKVSLALSYRPDPAQPAVPLVQDEDYEVSTTADGLPVGVIRLLGGYPDGSIIADYAQGFGWGAAYVFDTDGTELQRLFPSDPGPYDLFGASVGISEDSEQILAGALMRPYDWDPRDEVLRSGTESARGAAYVFGADGGGWAQEAELLLDSAEGFSFLGSGVAVIDRDRVIVGAPGNDAGIIDGGAGYRFEKTIPGSGAACVDPGESPPCWVLKGEAVPSDLLAGDQFGDAVAASESWLVYGAPQPTVGPGAVYLHRVPEPGAGGLLSVLAVLAAFAAKRRRSHG